MTRTAITSARSVNTVARTAITSAKTVIGVYRTPEIFVANGFNHLWDFRNGFNGVNGTIIPDVLGGHPVNTFGITPGTFYTAGQYYGTFDGSNDECRGNIRSFDTPVSAFSAIVSIYRTATLGNTAGIMTQFRLSTNRCWMIRVNSANPGTIQVYLSSDGTNNTSISETTTSFIALNAWQIIGVVYNGTTVVIYYQNNTGFHTTATNITGAVPASLFNTNAPISIGAYMGATISTVVEPFQGRIGIATINTTQAVSQANMQAVMAQVNTDGKYL